MRYNSHPSHSTLAINRAPYNTQLGQKLPIKPEIKCPLNLKLNGVIIKYRDVSYSILLCINNIRIVRRYDTCLTLSSIRPLISLSINVHQIKQPIQQNMHYYQSTFLIVAKMFLNACKIFQT